MKIIKKLSDTTAVRKVVGTYKRYERFAPALSFMAGFTWDSLTIKRIDLWLDNIILMAYILLLGSTILLVNLISEGRIKNPFILKYQEWYPLAIQFFMGGLFSAYVVLYFQSASITKNWIFLGLLVLVLVGNEFIRDRLTNLKLQFILYFFAVFSFFIFFIPVLLGRMNIYIFILSGFLSLAFILTFLYTVYRKIEGLSIRNFRNLSMILGGFFLLLNLLYVFNWIPPVPLSLKEGGIYHHVSRQGDDYRLKYEKGSWYYFWKESDHDFHYQEGDTVFCFASVFAPTRLNKRIYHHWQYYSEGEGEWKTTDRMNYEIKGGRDGGYRGYTYKRNLQPGKWRVNVETDGGRILGRIPFTLVTQGKHSHPLKTIYK